MDVLLLQYRLADKGIDRHMLMEAMGWSDGTRQTRCNAGTNWLVDELRTLIRLGFSEKEIKDIFFREEKNDEK